MTVILGTLRLIRTIARSCRRKRLVGVKGQRKIPKQEKADWKATVTKITKPVFTSECTSLNLISCNSRRTLRDQVPLLSEKNRNQTL